MKKFTLLIMMVFIASCNNSPHKLMNELYSCKSGLYDEEIYAQIDRLLSTQEEEIYSYFALKSSSDKGNTYFLIANYLSESMLLTATNDGYHLKYISSKEGKKLFNNITNADYSYLRSDYKENFPSNNCWFIRFYDSRNLFNLELLNSHGEKDSSENKIFLVAYNLLIDELLDGHNESNSNYIKFSDANRHNFGIKKIEEMNKKLNEDVFFELSKHYGKN